jgi:hypothetical protein
MNPHCHVRVLSLTATAGLMLVLTAASGAAQSLGTVAKAEEARRKGSATGKVYTNGSLPAVESSPAPAAAPRTAAPATPAPDAAAPAQGAKPDAAGPAAEKKAGDAKADTKTDAKKDEAYWRKRIQAERDGLSRAESFATALQSRINALSTDFTNRDDPAQRNQIGAERQKALAELDRVKKEIVDHTKAIAEIQQEARRENVPAGWVR